MSYVLVVFLYAGAMSGGDSVALTNVPGFKSEASCVAAGKAAVDMTRATFKDGKFVCLKQD